MSRSHLTAPQDDLANRRPVWDALSELFLDTALDRADLLALAQVLAQSPYSDRELAAIYHAEITPVCQANIGMAPGWWAGFPDGWIERGILERGLSAATYAANTSSAPIAWGWGDLQQRVLDLRRAASEADR